MPKDISEYVKDLMAQMTSALVVTAAAASQRADALAEELLAVKAERDALKAKELPQA